MDVTENKEKHIRSPLKKIQISFRSGCNIVQHFDSTVIRNKDDCCV